jgi:hypothetical protein
VNYCTTGSNNNPQDALASSVYLVNEKEHQIFSWRTNLTICSELSDYKEKHIYS